MKARLEFEPAERNYGPASASVRRILEGWAEIDWFSAARQPFRAAQRFAEHVARARLVLPNVYPTSFEARLVRGDWDRFATLCTQVRKPDAWSWKYGPLKQITQHHATAKSWAPAEVLDARAADVAQATGGEATSLRPSVPRPGDLFFRFGEPPGSVVWTGLGTTIDLASELTKERADLATWYMDAASMDALFAIEWQLAERNDDTNDNPFLPLLDCYASGVLPFGVGPGEFVLFVLAIT